MTGSTAATGFAPVRATAAAAAVNTSRPVIAPVAQDSAREARIPERAPASAVKTTKASGASDSVNVEASASTPAATR